jgi:hypothetical protein
MKSLNHLFAAVTAAIALGTMSVPVVAEEAADYEVTVTGLWTADRFPLEYPEANLISGPHFSGVIGASHNGKYEIYKPGTQPTAGLERLSEEGKHSPLDEEIKGAIAKGTAGALFESDPIKDFSKSVMSKVHVTTMHSQVSAVAMVAPSPDWFVGVSGVNLMEGGKFVTEKTVELYAYDAGSDDGMTYKAADMDNSPKKATTTASAKHFGGKPVARITFRKI